VARERVELHGASVTHSPWLCQPGYRDRPLATELYVNTRRTPTAALPGATARELHSRLPGYAPTPLRDAPELAAELGVGRVLLKDEAERFGLPSFKPLGASWAVCCAVAERLGYDEPLRDVAALREHARRMPRLTVICATDGNHGRAVARIAYLVGVDAEVLVPAGTAPARIAAIEEEGARVEVVDGDYDVAQRRSAELAEGARVLVSDTAWPGNERTPARVIEGYETIFAELDEQLERPPDLAVVPIGVGALAAAAAGHLGDGVRLAGVEPMYAACALASARAGRPVSVPGPHESVMAGLNCGTVSMLAWPALLAFHAFAAIDDGTAVAGMRRLAALGLDRGECAGGVAGAAAELLAGAESARFRDALALPADATVLLLLTEGVTDPEHFARAVGRQPAAA
jgi:diaminopropionate ammonia-lyase